MGFRRTRRFPPRVAGAVLAALLAGCAAPAGGTIRVRDSSTGDGDDAVLEYEWTRRGDAYARGDRRVPVAVVEHLRRIASTAPPVDDAALPRELRFTEADLERNLDAILTTVLESYPWLQLADPPALDLDLVHRVVRERLIDPATDTDYTELRIELPGAPPIALATASQAPYAQPWEVTVGSEAPRRVLSLEIARYAALLVDPKGPNARHLDGASYWSDDFWRDGAVWGRAVGEPWSRAFARELCAGCDGWDRLAEDWELRRADIGDINLQPTSLFVDVVAKRPALIDHVRWWNRYEDEELAHDWTTFLDVHARATAAAEQLPFLRAWKSADANRSLSLDAVGDVGHNETEPGFFHAPVWKHAGLKGEPRYELLLRIGGDWKATLLFGDEPDGAIVLTGDASLAGTDGVSFHPTTGEYAIVRPDGAVEKRSMPPIRTAD